MVRVEDPSKIAGRIAELQTEVWHLRTQIEGSDDPNTKDLYSRLIRLLTERIAALKRLQDN
jgi:hypothetical protein